MVERPSWIRHRVECVIDDEHNGHIKHITWFNSDKPPAAAGPDDPVPQPDPCQSGSRGPGYGWLGAALGQEQGQQPDGVDRPYTGGGLRIARCCRPAAGSRNGPLREITGRAVDVRVAVKGGRLRGERLHEASAGRSSSWAIGEARGHCPLHNHTAHNTAGRPDIPEGRRSDQDRGHRSTDCPLQGRGRGPDYSFSIRTFQAGAFRRFEECRLPLGVGLTAGHLADDLGRSDADHIP